VDFRPEGFSDEGPGLMESRRTFVWGRRGVSAVKSSQGRWPPRPTLDAPSKRAVEAVEALAHVMRNGKSEQARAIASDKLLDRGWGKATQPVAGDKDADAIKFESTVNMTDVAKLLLAKLGEVSS
jgi:hypothetical protein